MGLYESRSGISKGLKDLLTRWAFLKTQWDDAQSTQVEKQTLEPLEKSVRSAVEAMDAMKGLITSAKRDCGPTGNPTVKPP